VTTGAVRYDAVGRVAAEWRATRAARVVRRFRHGAGGTSLVCINGRAVVLKAWPAEAPTVANLPSALCRMDVMRGRGVPIPGLLEQGEVAGNHYLLYEYLPGRWPAKVGSGLLDEMISVVDTERGAAGAPAPDWQASLARMLGPGDPLFDISPAIVAAHPAGRELLGEARRRLQRCHPDRFAARDVVHADFAPENVLALRGRLAGVVDWERCRIGDASLDLVGVLFDIDAGEKAAPTVRRRLWRAVAERVPPDVLALYVAIYAVRYASWAINTPMERDILSLGTRLLQQTAC
jgi:Ser/Thr protein kinase RdoA (MazF antagonist)